MKRKLLKKIAEILLTAIERGIYSLSTWTFGAIAHLCFHKIATTAGWAVIGCFFGGLISTVTAIGSFGLLGGCKPYKLNKKIKETKTYEELEQDNEYNIVLNG